MKITLQRIRVMAIEGRHLAFYFADGQIREQGRKQINMARRIARRLGYRLQALGVDL